MATSNAEKDDAVVQQHFKIINFVMEAGAKLRVKAVPLATTARIYHKFFSHMNVNDIDPYLVATTALYLAGKVEEEHLRLRDVINVCYRCLYKDKPALEISSTYWALREAVANCELIVLRVLKFHVSFVHPHKYVLHYIKSLYDWLPTTVTTKFPIARTAWAILQDSYHGNMCLRYDPEHIAVAVLYMTLQCYGITVPTSSDAEYMWWEVLVEDLHLERIRRICLDIIALYNMETVVGEPPAEQKTTSNDVDDIDVFLYSDTPSQSKPLDTGANNLPKPKVDTIFSQMLSQDSVIQQQQQEEEKTSPGISAFNSANVVKKPVRITIPPGKAQQMNILGQMGSAVMQPRPQYSLSSAQDDEQYFAGPKSPVVVREEEDEDFDLLLFSRSAEQPKKKKNIFPF